MHIPHSKNCHDSTAHTLNHAYSHTHTKSSHKKSNHMLFSKSRVSFKQQTRNFAGMRRVHVFVAWFSNGPPQVSPQAKAKSERESRSSRQTNELLSSAGLWPELVKHTNISSWLYADWKCRQMLLLLLWFAWRRQQVERDVEWLSKWKRKSEGESERRTLTRDVRVLSAFFISSSFLAKPQMEIFVGRYSQALSN